MQHNHFFAWTINFNVAMDGTHDLLTVVLSYMIASLAGFCAFSILQFLRISRTNHAVLKLVGGGVLGLGIWSMHFTGMLAFSLPVPILYDVNITIFSVIPAALAAVLVLHFFQEDVLNRTRVFALGGLMAVGIGAMHFIGMMAMSMNATMVHHPIGFVASVLVSWVLASISLMLASKRLQGVHLGVKLRAVAFSLFFGFSVASMHYLAMMATYFYPAQQHRLSGIDNLVLGYSVVGVVIVLMIALSLALLYQAKINFLHDLASTHMHRIRVTIDNMKDGFVLLEKSGKTLLINKSFKEYFVGLTDEEVSEEINLYSLYDKLAEQHLSTWNHQQARDFKRLFHSAESNSGKVKLQTHDNRWWLVSKYLTEHTTQIHTWTDVSEQVIQEQALIDAKHTAFKALEDLKNTQNELFEARKMASLGRLVSGVAHELNTPLGVGITAMSSIEELTRNLQQQLHSGAIKKSHLVSSLEQIKEFELIGSKNLHRVAGLIQQFRDISVEQLPGSAKEFNLYKAVHEIVDSWRHKFHSQHKNIHFKISVRKSITLFNNQAALIEVLSLLIKNVADHATVKAQTCNIFISGWLEQNNVVLSFKDDGIGVHTAVANTIFEPFVTTNRHEGGVGLGLHIVYNLVCQKLCGKIHLVENSLDKGQENSNRGTEFSIVFPSKLST